jgi:hypothetical protein
MTSQIVRVSVDNVTPLWDQVGPLVEAALRGRVTHDAEDIRKILMAQACQLWVQWNDPLVDAMVVTEFAAYPKGVWVRVWMAAARPDAKMDDDGFLRIITQWADHHQCRGFEVTGRHGWLKRFPDAKAEGLLMRWTQ